LITFIVQTAVVFGWLLLFSHFDPHIMVMLADFIMAVFCYMARRFM